MKPADVHRLDQTLAGFAEPSVQIATMYKTLLVEIGDATVALELTKTWVASVVMTMRPQPPEAT